MTLVFGDVVALVVGTRAQRGQRRRSVGGVLALRLIAPASRWRGPAGASLARSSRIGAVSRSASPSSRGHARAMRFAHSLGFRDTGIRIFIAQFGASMELWQWAKS
ncbi:MAG: hypothetical protein WDM81_13865 [Rhizomicrobium sp.]